MTETARILYELEQSGVGGDALLQKFRSSARAEQKLACALRGFLTGQKPEEFIRYLLSRLRPTVTELIRTEDIAGLTALDGYGVYTQALTDEFLDAAVCAGAQEAAVWFLKLKAARYGFPDREFELLP